MLSAALAALTMLMSTSCVTTSRLTASASTQGQLKAGIALPDYPDDLKQSEPHAEVASGAECRSVLARERSALDRQNARGSRGAAWYDDVQRRFAAKLK